MLSVICTKKIAIIGSKKSGKTTVAELVTKYLTGVGFVVASLKHIHHENFTIDREGTDTSRFVKAGARVVGYISPREAGKLVKLNGEPKTLEEALRIVDAGNVDVILIEGFHRLVAERADVAKIVAFKDIKDLEERLHGTKPPLLAACTFMVQNMEPTYRGIPCVFLPRDEAELLKIIKMFMDSPLFQL
ncbi:MAG: molybdopterin-guanine dinucleotide biosynthesis protein B [Candidatus Nezhaarchaeota archaeon]|nr:molybdopterin-guanine dinucleotide biosynthesis protein B [Candidatus Nezhaarchaeota archaeon]